YRCLRREACRRRQIAGRARRLDAAIPCLAPLLSRSPAHDRRASRLRRYAAGREQAGRQSGARPCPSFAQALDYSPSLTILNAVSLAEKAPAGIVATQWLTRGLFKGREQHEKTTLCCIANSA